MLFIFEVSLNWLSNSDSEQVKLLSLINFDKIMIIQLPNGRIIECSVEQYLSLTDEEYNDLNGLASAYTKEEVDPFYNRFHKTGRVQDEAIENIEEYEPALDEIEAYEKLDDPYFHSDDS